MPNKLSELVNAMLEMREKEALSIAKEVLDGVADPIQVFERCREAMDIIGKRFEKGEYFLPELILAGVMLTEISDMVRTRLPEATEVKRLGKVVIGTVEGDIHDIGKNIVTLMLDISGFEVFDLGVNVPPARFVEAVKQFQPQVVGLSGLLTLAYDPMKFTIKALQEAGLRNKVKIMIGGGAMNDDVRNYVGADAYGPDVMAAVSLSKHWVGGE